MCGEKNLKHLAIDRFCRKQRVEGARGFEASSDALLLDLASQRPASAFSSQLLYAKFAASPSHQLRMRM